MSNTKLHEITCKSASEMTHTFKEHGFGDMGKGVLRIVDENCKVAFGKGYSKGFADGKQQGFKDGKTQGFVEGTLITFGVVALVDFAFWLYTRCKNSKEQNRFDYAR